MTIWESTDGSRWDRVGQLVDTSDVLRNRSGHGVRRGDRLAVRVTRVRFAHDNFCYETERCFFNAQSVLLTANGLDL